MSFAKFLFWCHLACGVVAGVVILIMSVTGALLTYRAADRRSGRTRGGSRSRRRRLMRRAFQWNRCSRRRRRRSRRPAFTGVTVRAGANSPVALAAGQRTLFVDPYDGRVLGEGVARRAALLPRGHRLASLRSRSAASSAPTGKAITGASQPRVPLHRRQRHLPLVAANWTRRQLRNITLFNGGLRGKARDFNWHNTIGFWSAIPLFVVVLGATVISYPWASDLAYRVVGEAPPARQRPPAAAQGPQGGPGGPGPERGGRARRTAWRRRTPAAIAGGDRHAVAEGRAAGGGLAQHQPAHPGRTADAPVVFTIDQGYAGQPQKRGTLTLNRASGEVVSWEPYASLSPGRRLRTWLRFVHTGEFYGLDRADDRRPRVVRRRRCSSTRVLRWRSAGFSRGECGDGVRRAIISNRAA